MVGCCIGCCLSSASIAAETISETKVFGLWFKTGKAMSNCLTHWGSMVNQSRLGVVWFEMDSVNMKMRESLGEKHRHFNPFHLCSRIDPSHAQFLKQIQSRTIFLEERFQLTVAAHARASVGMVWFCQKPRAKGSLGKKPQRGTNRSYWVCEAPIWGYSPRICHKAC